MRKYSIILPFFALACLSTASAASLESLAVDVHNASEPILCAEKDNVAIDFTSPEVRQFKIEAAYPAYIGSIHQDRWEPDWTACEDIAAQNPNSSQPKMITLFENDALRVTGLTFGTFWRPTDVPVRLGERIEHDIHLMQILVRRNDHWEEVMAFYPRDGYWRVHPLAPSYLGWTAYGSSFLIGPVEMDHRPVVNLTEVAFDPAAMTFTLSFAKEGHATVAVKDLTEDRLSLDVAFDRSIAGMPFAALRSMYVTEFNADVARIAAREVGASSWREDKIMDFKDARATDIWMGRIVPSRHNTSAPDMVFKAFRAQAD